MKVAIIGAGLSWFVYALVLKIHNINPTIFKIIVGLVKSRYASNS